MINRGIAMRTLALGWMLLTAVGCSVAADRTATPPDSRVSVTFVQPERFTDVKDSLLASPKGTADLLAEIDRYLHTAGERYVPAGLTLNLSITNIDLAASSSPGAARSSIAPGSCETSIRPVSCWSSA
jgi:hypothetical protein